MSEKSGNQQAPLLGSPAPRGLSIQGVHGLPDFRPGDDLAGAIAAAAPWIIDGDVLVVTSKVISKVEGQLVSSPVDPVERDALRRQLIDEQTVRLVAQVGRTKIVENRLGIVAAAAGIDASNVRADEIALLPEDPDASAERLVAAFAAQGIRLGVIITDTQGRAWRGGADRDIRDAAGVPVLDDHRGGIDEFGNELVVTQVAIGDELAAAADLVKGKLSGVPVAVVRGLDAPGEGQYPGGGRRLIRRYADDLFRLGTDLSIAQGRAEALAEIGITEDPGHATLHRAAVDTLTAWQPDSGAQAALRESFLGLLAARPDATQRSCAPGHLTASAVVLSADGRQVLLTLHPRVGRWLQLGGHCEPGDESLAAAALREATEESGIASLQIDEWPIQLDVHPITCSLGRPTRHFDVRFVVRAPAEAVPVQSEESDDLAWWPVDAVPGDLDPLLVELIAAATSN